MNLQLIQFKSLFRGCLKVLTQLQKHILLLTITQHVSFQEPLTSLTFNKSFILLMVTVDLELIPEILDKRQEYSLEGTASHQSIIDTHIHS